MSNALSSWKSTLPSDVMLDSGVLYIGASIFSAHMGGLSFTPDKVMRQIPFDGQKSDIAGLDRTVYHGGTLDGFNILEVPAASFVTLEPGATTVTAPSGGPSGATSMQPKAAGILYAAGDYLANVRAVWECGDGSYVQLRMMKALVSQWKLTGKDKEEAQFAVTIKARLDMAVTGQLIGTAPYVIEYFTVTP